MLRAGLHERHGHRRVQLQCGQLPERQYHDLRGRLLVQRRVVRDELQHVERYGVRLRLLLQRWLFVSHDDAQRASLYYPIFVHEWVLREWILLQRFVRRRMRRVQRHAGNMRGARRRNELRLVWKLPLRGRDDVPHELHRRFAVHDQQLQYFQPVHDVLRRGHLGRDRARATCH